MAIKSKWRKKQKMYLKRKRKVCFIKVHLLFPMGSEKKLKAIFSSFFVLLWGRPNKVITPTIFQKVFFWFLNTFIRKTDAFLQPCVHYIPSKSNDCLVLRLKCILKGKTRSISEILPNFRAFQPKYYANTFWRNIIIIYYTVISPHPLQNQT